MTREEAEATIDLYEARVKHLMARRKYRRARRLREFLALARLGAKVMAPTEDEIHRAESAFNEADGAGFEPLFRAALSALQDPSHD